MNRMTLPLALLAASLATACTAVAPAPVAPVASEAPAPTQVISAATPAPPASPGGIAPREPFPMRDKPWPEISYQTVEGTTKKLSESKGKSVLLVFWAHWCGHCQKELPKIDAVIAKNKPDLVYIPIEASQGTMQNVLDFAATYKIVTPLFFDLSGAAPVAYNVQSFPTAFRLAPDGTVYDFAAGELPDARFDQFMTPVVKP